MNRRGPAKPPESAARYREAVRQLAPQVDLWQRILQTHTRTAAGYCAAQVCGEPGTGRPHLVHPCPIRVAALSARDLHQESP